MTLEKLDELILRLKAGKPDMLLMSRRTRRQFWCLAELSKKGIDKGG